MSCSSMGRPVISKSNGLHIVCSGWSKPFNLRYGWILWGGGGLIIASSAVFLVKALVSSSSAVRMQNQVSFLILMMYL